MAIIECKPMNKKIVIIGGIVLLAIIIGAIFIAPKNKTTTTTINQTTPQVTETVSPTQVPPASSSAMTASTSAETMSKNVVIYSSDGFSPKTLTIKQGSTVTFKNNSSVATWPASASHPTHKVYPGSGIEKCGTSEEAKIFDACRGIATGKDWSFTFTNVGTWKYHDHLNPSFFGTIVVE